MPLETLRPNEQSELNALEAALHKRTRLTRLVAVVILLAAGAGGVWLAMGMRAYTPPDPSPLETLLTESFPELQLDWFDTIATSTQVNKRLLMDRQEKFMTRCTSFLEEVREVEPTLEAPFNALLETMRKHDQVSLLAETPGKALAAPVTELNKALAGLEPRFIIDVEYFEGVLDNSYLVGGMLCVYEVLETLRYSPGDGDEAPQLLVVRRRDSLPTDSYTHGYVKRDDTSLAFVLQDNATSFAADYIFPSFERADVAFSGLFGDRVPRDLEEPYRILLELVHLQLRDAAGVDETRFNEVAQAVSKRAKIFARVEKSAEAQDVRLKKPDGLVWPRTFASRVLLANTEANKRGEKLLYDSDKDQLIEVSRLLDDPEAERILRAAARLITRKVGFHEARHVVDVRKGIEAGPCIRERVRIIDQDPDFLRSVELECRAALTEIIEARESIRLTLMSLLNHLYLRSGTDAFYAARTVLHPLAFTDEDKSIPRGWEYVREMTLRLAAADEETLRERALAFHAECFGEYVPLTLQENVDESSSGGGCSLSRR